MYLRISFVAASLLLMVELSAQSYRQQLDQWIAGRYAALRAPTGWINLSGLLWLEKGKNTFGKGKNNGLVYPAKNFPQRAGTLWWKENGDVDWITDSSTTTIYHNNEGAGQQVAVGQYRFNIIKRIDKLGVRIRDLESPALRQFTGIQRFNTDTGWIIQADLIAAAKPTITITNVLGQTNENSSPGTLHFRYKGKEYTLDALQEDNELFIVFGDATSGKETYPAGRFLYAPMPGPDGKTILDFNKAINPPCAFSTYATCPLPPKQNILPIAVKAGEKNFDLHTLQ
jgi:uncharacterized protein (DUF1684 family)